VSRHHRALDRKRWRRVRLQVLDRNNWRCQRCGKAGRMEVDHVVPLHVNPEQNPFDPAGLQTLCRRCHFDKTRDELSVPDPERDAWETYLEALREQIRSETKEETR